jgi:hypothetical protein
MLQIRVSKIICDFYLVCLLITSIQSVPRMQLEIARLNNEWEDGEQRLGCYRDEFMV